MAKTNVFDPNLGLNLMHLVFQDLVFSCSVVTIRNCYFNIQFFSDGNNFYYFKSRYLSSIIFSDKAKCILHLLPIKVSAFFSLTLLAAHNCKIVLNLQSENQRHNDNTKMLKFGWVVILNMF